MTQAEINIHTFDRIFNQRMRGSALSFSQDFPTLYSVILQAMSEITKEENIKVKVHLQGCDDCTIFDITIPAEALGTLTLIGEMSKAFSSFDGMPTMTITKLTPDGNLRK